jgi:hypothetical protein
MISALRSAAPILPMRNVLPAAFASAVLAADSKTHSRNVPDLSFGQITSAIQSPKDGSWTVKVGSFRTSLAGPLPGQNKKPFDVATYHVSAQGKVSTKASAA